MSNSRTAWIVALALALPAVAGAVIVATPFNASAAGQDVNAERIARAFAVASADVGQAALVYQPAPAAVPGYCDGQTWPDIDPACIVSADGSSPEPVRIIY